MKILIPKSTVTHGGMSLSIYHGSIGEGLHRHVHDVAHLTMCHAGRIVIRKEGLEHYMDKNSQPVNLRANEWHEIEAIEDGTVFVNVFSVTPAISS